MEKKGKERRREGEGERKEGSKQARVKEKKKTLSPNMYVLANP